MPDVYFYHLLNSTCNPEEIVSCLFLLQICILHFDTSLTNKNLLLQSRTRQIIRYRATATLRRPQNKQYKNKVVFDCLTLIDHLHTVKARRGGAEVAGWTLDRKIRVRFPAYPHRVWALWWQGGKRRLRTSWCPCRGRLGTLKTPSCPWRGCPAAGQNVETGHLSRHYIAEISLNVTLNHNQQSTIIL